jgi:hypothetical protein
LALAGVGVESPAVVRAFDLLAVELSAGKRHTAMRAGVAQGKGLAVLVASDQQGLFEQHGLGQLSAAELIGWQRTVPEAEEHERVGRLPPQRANIGPAGGPGLGLEWEVVRHWTSENTAVDQKLEPTRTQRTPEFFCHQEH